MPLAILLAIAATQALRAPIGWTAQGPDRAVISPADPGRGELRELSVPGIRIDPQVLVAALSAGGNPAVLLACDADGTVTLDLGQGLIARARALPGGAGITWYLVQATRAASAQLDADALLAAVMPRAGHDLLTGAAVEVLPAGADGSLWDPAGSNQPAAPVLAGPWGGAGEPTPPAWAPQRALVGIWSGGAGGTWAEEQMLLRLDVDGHLRIEEQGPEGTRVTEGTWGVQADLLRFAPLTAAPVVSSFSVDTQSLTFVWQGRTVTLLRRR
jgi:hypothetical protein